MEYDIEMTDGGTTAAPAATQERFRKVVVPQPRAGGGETTVYATTSFTHGSFTLQQLVSLVRSPITGKKRKRPWR